jgi:hypothetical protein
MSSCAPARPTSSLSWFDTAGARPSRSDLSTSTFAWSRLSRSVDLLSRSLSRVASRSFHWSELAASPPARVSAWMTVIPGTNLYVPGFGTGPDT